MSKRQRSFHPIGNSHQTRADQKGPADVVVGDRLFNPPRRTLAQINAESMARTTLRRLFRGEQPL